MALSPNAPATDSAEELNKIIGADSTATFENDPKFIDANPTASGSSENLGAVAADEDEDEEDDDGDFDEDDGTDDEEETDEEDAGTDEEDEDDEEDDLEDEDDLADEDEDLDDEDDEEDEDDAAEVAASPALRADGLLGYEDEADDVQEGISEKQGNAERAKKEAALKDGEDDDAGDDGRENATDEDKLNADEDLDLDEDDSLTSGEDIMPLAQRLSALGDTRAPARLSL